MAVLDAIIVKERSQTPGRRRFLSCSEQWWVVSVGWTPGVALFGQHAVVNQLGHSQSLKVTPLCRKSPNSSFGQHCAQARLPNRQPCVVHVLTDWESSLTTLTTFEPLWPRKSEPPHELTSTA